MSGLQMIKVEKDDLLKKVKKNRKHHREQFDEAIKGYRSAVIKELDDMIREAKNGKRIRRNVNLPEPMDHTDEYDTIIKMLEMSVEDQLQISFNEFQQYVEDEWGWKSQFIATSSAYVSN